jgi:multidrug efflux pump subunit AcrA (membrane-fusion protein)
MTSRTLGAVLVAAALTVACTKQAGTPKQPPVPVAVTRATRAAVAFNLTADGTVEPMQTAFVQAQVGGLLTRVTFKEGDDLQSGQVLFQIDPRPYQAILDQASAALARDEATFANATVEAQRYASLAQKDYVTKEQADQLQATAQSTSAAVKADSAAVESARINLDWTTIRAPISGRAGQLLVRQGNLIRGGTQQPLVLINQIRPILVHFALPATTLPAVQRYAGGGALPVTVVPGMPPSASAQPVSTGPTPAYTTDAPVGDSVAGGGDDPAAPSSGGGQSPGSASRDPSAGAHRSGSGAATSGGPPSGAATGTPGASSQAGYGAAGDPSGTPGQPPPGHAGPGAPGSTATGARPARGMAASGASRPAATMPGLPGVAAPTPSEGSLTFIDNQVDTTTGTVLLKATFGNGAGTLWPGQFVATTLRLFVEQNALVVPAQAVMTGQQGTYVYLVDASGTAQQRPVAVERTSANRAVIASGLAEGDQVVTDGQSRLTPGSKVTVRGVVPPGAGGSAPPGSGSGSG